MFTPYFWSTLDAALGVPCELSVSQGAARFPFTSAGVSTKLPLIYARRNRMTLADARLHLETTFAEFPLLKNMGLSVGFIEPDTLFLDVGADALWQVPHQPDLEVLAARAHDIRKTAPDVVIAKRRMIWDELTTRIGEDAALWATLNAANAKPPFTISGDLETLASRRDENPLALIRRAHAASVIRLDAASTFTGEERVKQHEPDTYLRATLVWANRVSYDTKRHGRTRPLTLALEKVAQTVIRHLEQAPVTRTDSLALEAARTLFVKSLACVNVAAPVPA